MAARERVGVTIGVAFLLVAAAWVWAIAPAWDTLKAAPSKNASLDSQLESMQRMATEVKAIQSAPKISYNDALKALESATKDRFGDTGSLRVLGDRATLTLKGASSQALAAWLPQVRVLARAIPSEVKLTRTNVQVKTLVGATTPASAAISSPLTPLGATWDGTVALSIYGKP